MNEQVITIASTSPGFLGFASECVDCKEIFDPVKERLLGNVIVVDTLKMPMKLQNDYAMHIRLLL